MVIAKNEIRHLGEAILNSYAQVFFSDKKVLAILLLLVSFFDYTAGLCGLLSVVTGILLVQVMGMDKASILKGLYGFNNLLVGLGVGLNFQPSLKLFTLVVFASLLTTLITFALQGVLGKYNLPYLSLPFLFGIWITLMASNSFTTLGLSARGIYSHNEIYALGGLELLDLYQRLEGSLPFLIVIYFKSLGAIFFQYNILAGILISIGLLTFSRIVFTLSIVGFVMALSFYEMFGADITQLSYSYIGFNYILSAIAVGGYFLVPSGYSYLASVLILPIVVLLSFGFEQIMATFYISIYSLPFNLLVIMFLYALRFRTQRAKKLREVIIQQGTPEKNLYLQTNYVTRMRSSGILSVSLPVMGEWKISQGYNGKYTHKDDWRHAIDFVIADNEGKEYKNQGLVAEDYYCFAKNVISPADGYIVELADGVEDNTIGDMNLINNWGNSIVIQLATGLYAQLSHIKSGTFKVNKGDYVKKGQLIGQVGNSGRSPYPHLHFQIQNAPHIGAKTIDYPLVNYLSNKNDLSRYHAYGRPIEGESLSNVVATPIIANAFRFTPGQQYTFRFSFPDGKGDSFPHFEEEYLLEVNSDIYKNTYFECKKTGAKAWFYNDGQVFHFSNYTGNRKSFLFYFMLALFKVELGYTPNISVKDQIPIHFTFSGVKLFIQDFLAPFFQYLKSNYQMKFVSIDDDFSPQEIHFQTDITNRFGNRELQKNTFDIHLKEDGIHQISINIAGKKAIGACIKRG